jgi:hypothetical protein
MFNPNYFHIIMLIYKVARCLQDHLFFLIIIIFLLDQ